MVPYINYGARPLFFLPCVFSPDFIFGVERKKKGGGGKGFFLFVPSLFGGES